MGHSVIAFPVSVFLCSTAVCVLRLEGVGETSLRILLPVLMYNILN